MSAEEREGTLRPPLVLFGRYGSNTHCKGRSDDNYHFQVADKSERRAKKVNKKPYLMGYGGGMHKKQVADKRKQEQEWINGEL